MAEITNIGKNASSAEKMVKDATLAFRQYMDIPFIPEEEEFLFEAFGGKPGQGKVKTPKKLTVEQAIAFLDYSGFPLADENAKFSIASSIKLNAPELFDDASFKAYEKKFGSTMEMQEKGASASKNIVAGKPLEAANEPVAAKGKSVAGKTIQEAFESYLEGNRSADSISSMERALKELDAAGFPSDTPLSELNSEAGIERLHKWATGERYKGVSAAAGAFASRVKTLITSGTGVDEVNVLANWEKTNRNTNKEFGIRLTRQARKLELPDFDSFNKAVDATARQIPDKEARAFFLIKMLTGLRNPDIVNLQLGKAIKGADYGSFDPSIQKIYALSNKGERINYDLGEVVHGILADLAADAEAGGRTTLFSKTGKSGESFYRDKINPVMRRNMDALGLEIFDLKKGEAVPFSIRDLRKNIFDILDEEEGPGAANKVLGHSSGNDVGLKHYKVERTRRASLSGLQKSQELFSSLYLESIGFDNPQLVFGEEGYGFSSDKFKPSTVTPLTTDVPQEQQLAETLTRTAEGRVESTINTTSDSLTKRINRLEDLISKASELQQQAEEVLPPAKKKVSPKETLTDTVSPSVAEKLKADGLYDLLYGVVDKLPGPVKKALGPLGLGLTAATAASTVSEVEAATGSPALAAVAGASEFGPVGYSDIRDIAAARAEPDPFGMTPASRIAAEEQAGFIDLGRDRGPEAAPVNQDQGFLSR